MKQLTPFSRAETTKPFFEDLEHCMHRLRGSLTDLLAAAGEDPRQPQQLSRNCGINKNLAWKVCKIINATDPNNAAQHVPGTAGLRILLAALETRGASPEYVTAVETAAEDFERVIQLHVGDRSNLELYLGSTDSDGIHSDLLEAKRRLAYQGSSVIWGVQARLGMSLKVVSPNVDDPERADLASVRGLFGFRRLRPTASWSVMRERTLSENVEVGHEPPLSIDENDEGTGTPLVHAFCSTPLPETRTIIEGETKIHELCEGPVGNTASLDVTLGSIELSHVPVRTNDPESVGEHYCHVDTPVEMMQFDLFLHRDLPFAIPPGLVTYSALSNNGPRFPLSSHTRFHLPGRNEVQTLGSTSASFASPHIPRYGRLIQQVCRRMGRDMAEFTGYRFTLAYPPLATIFVMHHGLGKPRD